MNEVERRTFIAQRFRERFDAVPSLWARAPGRVDLMGSHTDYNQGYVMTMTIDGDTWMAARPRSDRTVAIYSLDIAGGGEFDLDAITHDRHSTWTNYVRGVARVMEDAGYALRGFDGLIHSTVPFGSGLSSSAALEMATAVLFQMAGGFELDPIEMALLGQKAENQFVGVACGILDQYSSAMGEAGCALLLDCRDLGSRPVPIASGISVVICDTRAERNLVGSEYDSRRAECEEGVRILQEFYPNIGALRDVSPEQFEARSTELPDVVAKRCRFIIEENQRVLDLAQELPNGEPSRLEALFAASYSGARDLFEIGAPSMEMMINAMRSGPGVLGARQAGAGFGGCMVALVERNHVEAFGGHVQQAYAAAARIEPHVYEVTPSAGAGALDVVNPGRART